MPAIRPHPLPDGTLLDRYRRNGAYTDCYTADIAATVTQARFVEAFYTTRVFKLERLILRLAVSKPSTDAQAAQLARGEIDAFAAWDVEDRREDELLLCDLHGRTRSWLMVRPLDDGSGGTRLHFGSAVVPVHDPRSGETRMGTAYRALLGFHKLYSRILLRAARARIESSTA